MRNRDSICTTLFTDRAPYKSGGLAMSRIYLPQKVHAGPKTTIDREVVLVMDPGEVLNLAVNLIGQLTPDQIQDPKNAKHIDILARYLRLAKSDELSEEK